jgi:2-succinyl-6-hydroxy-2,4-cyclohexadiene-1-carboxylate synthase
VQPRVQPRVQLVDVGDGLEMRVVSSGQGTPLVLLHGFTGSAETWAPLSAALGDRYTTHAVELPGHGGSAAPDDAGRYALGRLAADLARLLDVLGVERAAVLGYSLGGRAALRFALEHPGRVSALVLESTSPGIVDPVERAARRAADDALAESIEREGIARFVERWEQLPLWASQSTLPDAVRERLRAQRMASSPRGLANSLRGAGAAAEQPVIERLDAVAVPTLLIAGALDTKYVALGRLMEQAMPRARLAIVDRAGHAVHLERPDAFAALVAEFLDAVR